MSVTVLLELKFKPEAVARAHWVIYEVWETVEDDEAYRAFRAGDDGKIADLPPLLAAPPVKTRFATSDV
jgi:hypothetical protein